MKNLLILAALLCLGACAKNEALPPSAPSEPYILGECKVYLAVVDGAAVVASPNCYVGMH